MLKDDPDLWAVVERHLAEFYTEALARVRAHRDAIKRVARALIERRLLSGDEIRALIGTAPTGSEP